MTKGMMTFIICLITSSIIRAETNSAVPAGIGGLSSGFGKVIVENLQPGITYRVSQLYTRIGVTNTSDFPVNLKMELFQPASPDIKDDGFEPIPDLKWAFLEQENFTIEPWKDIFGDLILRIPKEKKYQGKKYQLNIWSHTMGVEGQTSIALGLMHKLLFTVADKPTEEASKQSLSEGSSFFSVEPFEVNLDEVPLFDKTELWKAQKSRFVIKNPHNKPHKFRFHVLRDTQLGEHTHKGYEPGDNTWVNFQEEEITVPAGGAVPVKAYLKLPPSRALLGQKIMFVIRTTMLDGEMPFAVDARLYVKTTEKFQRRWIQGSMKQEEKRK